MVEKKPRGKKKSTDVIKFGKIKLKKIAIKKYYHNILTINFK